MRLVRVARPVAWLLLLAVSAFTLSPAELRPVTAAHVDWERFAAFAMVGGAFALGYPRHRVAVLLLVVASVALLEVLQNLVPGRHGRLADGLFKAAGAIIGAGLALLAQHSVARRLPQSRS